MHWTENRILSVTCIVPFSRYCLSPRIKALPWFIKNIMILNQAKSFLPSLRSHSSQKDLDVFRALDLVPPPPHTFNHFVVLIISNVCPLISSNIISSDSGWSHWLLHFSLGRYELKFENDEHFCKRNLVTPVLGVGLKAAPCTWILNC